MPRNHSPIDRSRRSLLPGVMTLALLGGCQNAGNLASSDGQNVNGSYFTNVTIDANGRSFRLATADGKPLTDVSVIAGGQAFTAHDGTLNLPASLLRTARDDGKGFFRVFAPGYAPRQVWIGQADWEVRLLPLAPVLARVTLPPAGGRVSGGGVSVELAKGALPAPNTPVSVQTYTPEVTPDDRSRFTTERASWLAKLKGKSASQARVLLEACADDEQPLPCALLEPDSLGIYLMVGGPLDATQMTYSLDLATLEASCQDCPARHVALRMRRTLDQIAALPGGLDALHEAYGISRLGDVVYFPMTIPAVRATEGYVQSTVDALLVLGVKVETTVVNITATTVPPGLRPPGMDPGTGTSGGPLAGTTLSSLGWDATPLIGQDGTSLTAAGASSLIGLSPAGIVANDGATVIAGGAGNVVAGGAGNVIAGGAGNVIAGGAGNLVNAAGSLVLTLAGSTLLGQDGTSVTTVGGASVIAGGAGNVVAGGAGNIVAGGSGNLVSNANGSLMGHVTVPSGFTSAGDGGTGKYRGLLAYADAAAVGGSVRAVMADGTPLSAWVPIDAQGNYTIYHLPDSPPLFFVEATVGTASLYGLAIAPHQGRVYAHLNAASTGVTRAIQAGLASGTLVPAPTWLFSYNIDVLVAKLLMSQQDALDAVAQPLATVANLVANLFSLAVVTPLTFTAAPAVASNAVASTYLGGLNQPVDLAYDGVGPVIYIAQAAGGSDVEAYTGGTSIVALGGTLSLFYQYLFNAAQPAAVLELSGGTLWGGESGGTAQIVQYPGLGLRTPHVNVSGDITGMQSWPAGGGLLVSYGGLANGIDLVQTGLASNARFAGDGGAPGYADNGTGSLAQFDQPHGVAVWGTDVFVADTGNNCIRRIDTLTAAHAVTTYAGVPGPTGFQDGPAATARFTKPWGLAVDPANGDLYVSESGGNRIRVIKQATQQVLLVAGDPAGAPGLVDGVGAAARFSGPTGLAWSAPGNLLIADQYNNAIRQLSNLP